MRWRPIAFLLFTPLASAQTAVTPGQIARVLRDFEPHPGDTPLRCEVAPLPPVLNFAFRFQAGYTFHVPLAQYPGATRGWSALTSITPEGGNRQPTVLLAYHQLSDASKSDQNFDIHGAYFLGVGRYSVESALRDDRNRICRKQWRITVQLSRSDRAAQSELPPYTVRPVSAPALPDTRHPDHTRPMRLSLLLNAAAFSPRRIAMRPIDRAVLLGSLTALLEHLPATSVRLVVFSLEQQREVFRSDNFALPELSKVADAIGALQLATVDVHVLQKPLGHVEFLAALIHRELQAEAPADTVIFLGPMSRYGNKIPADALQSSAPAQPRFFYVRYEGPRRRAVPSNIAGIPDTGIAFPGGRSGGPLQGTGSGTESTGSSSSAADVPPPSLPRLPPSSGSGGMGGGGSAGTSGSSGGQGAGGGGGGRGTGGGRGGGTGLPPMPPSMEPQSDMIAEAVSRLKGKTLAIHSPSDLAKAIRKIEGKR
jgi:hypothetical protein